ncbi:MAG: hypothetical protein ABR98_02450 [Cryomorphaceae bacterium BACL7 MAG-120910-bin2]|mgnify:FL=1|jgi:cell wall-associated NlpC family hydrolase|nr:MAG: hypothetical protein ABR98_02450 [Cryomorphaceae bacterium BACL7 MAG-120910-bin2]KRO69634.1 MAG: hypothetical protein ABR88_06515 [Cryomorphaceae bacterium BACL7 MAG-120322-bin74]KRO82626.1 MAG: hypothetical protein ABR87_07100 [Cryomorphaceae bacterium BACL7 MAG-121220-bin83]
MTQRSYIRLLVAVTCITFAVPARGQADFRQNGDKITGDSLSWPEVIAAYEPLLGQSYQSAGKKPGGFDCSGLLQWVFAQQGATLPASSKGYPSIGKSVHLDSVQVGDFILFSGRNAREVGHVGLCVGFDNGYILMLHSATHSGVLIEPWQNQSYYTQRFMSVKRLYLFTQ